MAVNIGDELVFTGSRVIWRITGFDASGSAVHLQEYKDGLPVEDSIVNNYSLETIKRRVSTGSLIIRKHKKGKVKIKKKGPEMQHCPFCMAAWLNDEATEPRKMCKYCGAGLM